MNDQYSSSVSIETLSPVHVACFRFCQPLTRRGWSQIHGRMDRPAEDSGAGARFRF